MLQNILSLPKAFLILRQKPERTEKCCTLNSTKAQSLQTITQLIQKPTNQHNLRAFWLHEEQLSLDGRVRSYLTAFKHRLIIWVIRDAATLIPISHLQGASSSARRSPEGRFELVSADQLTH